MYKKITAIAAVFILLLVLYASGLAAGEPFEPFILLFYVWAVIPYAFSYFTIKITKNRKSQSFQEYCLIIMSVLGGLIYIDALFIHKDAQGALVFLFLPLLMIVYWGIVATVSFFIKD